MASYALGPAQEDVAGGLHHPLALHDPLARLSVPALRQVILEHRSGRLLDLQEQWVLLVATLEQHDEGSGADAADAHDLAGHVDDLEALQEPAPIVLQGRPVGAELVVDDALELVDRETDARCQVAQRDRRSAAG